MSSSTASSFWKEQASDTRPGKRSSTKPSTSSAVITSTSAGSCRLAAKQDLLERVAAQPESERLERDDFLGRDVPEIDVRPEVLDEPRLARLRRSLEDEIRDRDLVGDLVDQPGTHVAVLAEDPGRAALTCLRDHLPRAGALLFLDPFHPLVRRVDDVGILRPDFREHGEVTREIGDQFELLVARDVE